MAMADVICQETIAAVDTDGRQKLLLRMMSQPSTHSGQCPLLGERIRLQRRARATLVRMSDQGVSGQPSLDALQLSCPSWTLRNA